MFTLDEQEADLRLALMLPPEFALTFTVDIIYLYNPGIETVSISLDTKFCPVNEVTDVSLTLV
jgi:hypothetical protein